MHVKCTKLVNHFKCVITNITYLEVSITIILKYILVYHSAEH